MRWVGTRAGKAGKLCYCTLGFDRLRQCLAGLGRYVGVCWDKARCSMARSGTLRFGRQVQFRYDELGYGALGLGRQGTVRHVMALWGKLCFGRQGNARTRCVLYGRQGEFRRFEDGRGV